MRLKATSNYMRHTCLFISYATHYFLVTNESSERSLYSVHCVVCSVSNEVHKALL